MASKLRHFRSAEKNAICSIFHWKSEIFAVEKVCSKWKRSSRLSKGVGRKISNAANGKNGLLRRLAGSKWGSDAKTLRTATFALIHSATEYCAPVWCRSKHTRLVDKPIHDALRLVSDWMPLRPTPIDNLFVLAGITPTELRRKRATLSLARRAMMDPEHFLHDRLFFTPTTQQRDLKSRHPFLYRLRWNYWKI